VAKDKDTYTVERSATMAADPQRIYEQLVDLRKWQNWSPWEDLDPQQERTFSGAESGPGAAYAWSGSSRAGRGRMEIIEATAPSSVRIALNFEKPIKSANTTVFALRPEGAGTLVTWTLTGQHSAISRAMARFMDMDAMVGKDFETGLARLKAVVESPQPQ
jgi:uncharacterized protein YndB with AHSA1/START domain